MLNLFLLALTTLSLTVNKPQEPQSTLVQAGPIIELSGQIIDAMTKEPLAGATVCIEDGLCVYTDLEGEFRLKVSRSNCRLSVKMVSYQICERVLSPEELEQSKMIISLEK